MLISGIVGHIVSSPVVADTVTVEGYPTSAASAI
jgi:hypothetical protein